MKGGSGDRELGMGGREKRGEGNIPPGFGVLVELLHGQVEHRIQAASNRANIKQLLHAATLRDTRNSCERPKLAAVSIYELADRITELFQLAIIKTILIFQTVAAIFSCS